MDKPFARRWMTSLLTLAVAVALGVGVSQWRSHWTSTNAAPATASQAAERGHMRANFDALPLAFEANQGQTDPQVKYLARGNGYTAFLTADETVFAMHSGAPSRAHKLGKAQSADKGIEAAIRIKLAGANAKPEIVAQNELPGHSNYFIGNDRSKWQTGVKQFAEVAYRGVYPGVGMAFHGQQRQLEFDFVVAPGASVAPIRFGVTGTKQIAIDGDGNLVLSSAAGDVLLHKPVAYQKKNDAREIVDSRFVVAGNTVGFEMGNYDRSRELVIDPSVSYATYLGGNAEDDGYSIAINSSGDAFVTGQTSSTNFPTAGSPLHNTNQGAAGTFDVFVSELSPDGSSLIYSTYIGGSSNDAGVSIALDASGNAYIAGGTQSSNFPTTSGVVQTTFGGAIDAFVLELNSTGSSLLFSTFLGGTGNDSANGVAVDSTAVYVVGSTDSSVFPTHNALQSSLPGVSSAFVSKLNTSGTAFVYSTYFGGANTDTATAVDVDSSGNAYVTGTTTSPTPGFPVTSGVVQSTFGGVDDAFVTVLNSSGSSRVYSTYLGGSGIDQGLGIAVDKTAGNAYVTGFTQSSGSFPLKSSLQSFTGTQDVFITELSSTGTSLVYSTLLGGGSQQSGTGIALDSGKNAYVVGSTNSTDFPKQGATQSSNGGGYDAFVSQIASGGGSMLFSTYLGGAQNENTNVGGGNLSAIGGIAVDNAGANIYVVGNTASNPFPTTTGSKQPAFAGGSTDAYVAKFSTGSGTTANFTISNGALSNASGNPGVSATATITVTSTNGFNSAVSLACTVSPVVSKGPTCSLNPNSVTPPANSTITSTLSVVTTAASARLEAPAAHRSIFYAMIVPVFGIVLAGFGGFGSRHRKLLGFLTLGLMLAGLLILPACSSSYSSGGGNSGTPAGSYTITVAGTSGSATATGTPTLTLAVN